MTVTTCKSLLRIAQEALNTGNEIEKEYGFFIKVNAVTLDNLISTAKKRGFKCEGILEIALPTKIPYNGIKSRIRAYLRSNGVEECELTTKVVVDSITKTEHNSPISITNFQSLAGLGASAVVRKRYIVPLYRDDHEGPVETRVDGSPLVWEIDVYLDGTSKESFDARSPCLWIKVDLEVDSPMSNVVDMLPIKGELVFPANSELPDCRAIIDNLYSDVYPVTKYTGLEFWDNQEAIMDLARF